MNQPVYPDVPMVGSCSIFGGRSALYSNDGRVIPDPGMTVTEGLALFEPSQVFSAHDPRGCPLFSCQVGCGLGHGLNSDAFYCAMRWEYGITPKDVLRRAHVQVCALDQKGQPTKCVLCRPVDWGPSDKTTRRLIDLSPGALIALGLETDAIVQATLILA